MRALATVLLLAAYPADFAATVKSDGTILFPQHTTGRVKGASLTVDGEPVLTVNPDGTLKGIALARHYAFTDAAIRPAGDAGTDKGLDIHIPPPSQWFK